METKQVVKCCGNCFHDNDLGADAPCNKCIQHDQWSALQDKRCSNCLYCDDLCASIFGSTCGPDKRNFSARAVPSETVEPKHYSRFKIQPTTFCVENNLNFLQGNIIKYVCRFPYKGGVMDLKKAARYIEELIARAEVDNGKSAA